MIFCELERTEECSSSGVMRQLLLISAQIGEYCKSNRAETYKYA